MYKYYNISNDYLVVYLYFINLLYLTLILKNFRPLSLEKSKSATGVA